MGVRTPRTQWGRVGSACGGSPQSKALRREPPGGNPQSKALGREPSGESRAGLAAQVLGDVCQVCIAGHAGCFVSQPRAQ